MRWRSNRAGLLLCLALLIPALPAGAAGTPVATLEGQELQVADELGSGVESALGSLLSGQMVGEVTRVTVTSDEGQRITVRVSYSGFEGGRMWAEALNSGRKLQSWITTGAPLPLGASSGEVEFVLDAGDRSPATGSRSSSFVRLSVARSDRSVASFRRTYRMAKTWGTIAGAPEAAMIANITPKPIGTTATLTETPSYPLPPRSGVATAPASSGTRATLAGTRVVQPSGAPPRPTPTPTPAPAPAPSGSTPRIAARSIVGMRAAAGTQATMSQASAPRTGMTLVASKTQAAVAGLDKSTLLTKYDHFHFGLGQNEVDKGATGPGANAIRPFSEGVKTEDIDLDLSKILNVAPEVYQDRTAASGVFYYLPNSYHLRWAPEAGYDLKQLYSGAAQGQAGEVMMAARLDARIGPREEQVAAGIVRDYAQRHGLPFTELRPIAIDSVTVSFASGLGIFEIPADKVAVHGLSDVLGQLDVAWVTSERTRDFILEALLQDIGVSGTVTFQPTGGGLGPRQVDVRMLLADDQTFGPFAWKRGEPWQNRTAYPITLRYLHALRNQAGSPAVVHTWSLGDTRVAPGGVANWNASRVPTWLDGQVQRFWLDYTVDRNCKPCDEQVVSALTGGVTRTGSTQITFHTLTPLADLSAHEVSVEVRSRFFDPEARTERLRTTILNKDGAEFTLGPLFMEDRDASAATEAQPLFYYRLAVVLKDGQSLKGVQEWIPSTELRVPIGRHQLETSLGSLPPK